MDASVTIANSVPAGTVMDFAGSSAPTGYLLCDGSTISRTTYARLFSIIGTTWGAGDGSSTFKLPDLRGRVAVGAGTGSGLSARTLAATGGEETHVLTSAEMPSHTHTQNSHNHPVLEGFAATYTGEGATTVLRPGTGDVTQSRTATNQNTGGDGAHENMQPFAVLSKIIKY